MEGLPCSVKIQVNSKPVTTETVWLEHGVTHIRQVDSVNKLPLLYLALSFAKCNQAVVVSCSVLAVCTQIGLCSCKVIQFNMTELNQLTACVICMCSEQEEWWLFWLG